MKIISDYLIIWFVILLAGQDSHLYAQHVLPAPKEIAITFDDLPLSGPKIPIKRIEKMMTKLIGIIRKNGMPAAGFVNEKRLYVSGEVDKRIAILKMWRDAGLELGNHTFSHPSLQVMPLAAFQEDVIRGETVTNMLLAEKGQKMRYFRHPFLRTGPTLAVKTTFEGFLQERGYTVAPVTIENLDWLFNAVYTDAKSRGTRKMIKKVGDAYLRFTEAVFVFYEKVSVSLLGYQMKHVLLLHANELNADYLSEVAALMKKNGYHFITLESALADKAYRLPDHYAGPAGVSWLFRWDYTGGKKINWREEPEPPQFIQKMYQDLSKGK